MKVLSTNVGRPKLYEFGGVSVMSSMRRTSLPDGIKVFFDRVDGDEFSVPNLHGTSAAVVYAYSASVFEDLSRLFAQDVGAGNVGENLTIDDLDESKITVGDEYEVGSTRLRVSGPRYPCNRLNFCFQRKDALELFTEYRRPGVYFAVVREGTIAPGDQLMRVHSAGGSFSVLDLYDALRSLRSSERSSTDREVLSADDFLATRRALCERVVADPLIPEHFRKRFLNFL